MPDVLASDDERDAAVARLRRAALEGRLDSEELEDRVARALAARTRGELAELVADLPVARAAGGAVVRPPRPTAGGFGLLPFHQQHVLASGPDASFADAVGTILPALHRAGYQVVDRRAPDLLVLEARERPGWVPFVCVFGFPFGLMALVVKRRLLLTLTFDRHPEGTLMTVQGEARRGVRKAFAGLAS